MASYNCNTDFEKPSRASMEEYSAFIRAESAHTPRRLQLHITPCAGGVIGLSLLFLLTVRTYLLLLLRNLPLEVQSLVLDQGYNGPLPIKYDATHGYYVQCPESPSLTSPTDCTFDILAHGWVPSPCFDAEMHTDTLAAHSYEFFRSRFGHQEVTQDVILQGNMSIYSSELWVPYAHHVDSCLYLLNGSVRATAIRSAGRLDSWLDDRLMQHCFDAIRTNGDTKKTQGRVKTVFDLGGVIFGVVSSTCCYGRSSLAYSNTMVYTRFLNT